MSSRDFERGAGGASRRDAVVDDDHRPARERDHRSATAIQVGAPLHLTPFTGFRRGDVARRDPRQADHVIVEHAYAVLADRAHAELWLEGDTQFSYHDHIEGCLERSCDFERDRHASPREADDDRMLGTQVLKAGGQLLAGVAAIPK